MNIKTRGLCFDYVSIFLQQVNWIISRMFVNERNEKGFTDVMKIINKIPSDLAINLTFIKSSFDKNSPPAFWDLFLHNHETIKTFLGCTKKLNETFHLHISEKKIHEGIFMFVKQSKRREREKGSSFLLLMIIFSGFLTTKQVFSDLLWSLF